jgi:hypothetical protein
MGIGAGLNMKANILRSFTILITLALMVSGSLRARAADEEGVALAIVYDTSGSMKQPVRDGNGKMSPKYIIAKRALEAIVKQLQTFATNSATGAPRRIDAGLFVFSGNGATELVNFSRFDPKDVQRWTKDIPLPSSGTPLGNALTRAGQTVLNSKLAHKHVLVITDGINTVGPDPSVTMPKLKQQAAQNQASLSVHFVAFDVDAKVFAPMKRLGATVVGASDEKQLNTQLEFILQRKILLEDEEPAKK